MSTEKWLTQLDQVTAAFRDAFGTLSGEELNWKPDGETWSIAQNIDHLIVTNSTYFPIIRKIRQNNYEIPWIGRVDWICAWLGRTILNSVQPDRQKKMKTFPIWEPSVSDVSADIVHRFEKHQTAVKQMISECEDLLRKKMVISSPANKFIVYKLETAFDIIVTHERRHLEQAREVFRLHAAKV